MSDEILKPCPFCGAEATIDAYQLSKGEKYDIFCTNKNCFIKPSLDKYVLDKEEAIRRWNTRSEEGTK